MKKYSVCLFTIILMMTGIGMGQQIYFDGEDTPLNGGYYPIVDDEGVFTRNLILSNDGGQTALQFVTFAVMEIRHDNINVNLIYPNVLQITVLDGYDAFDVHDIGITATYAGNPRPYIAVFDFHVLDRTLEFLDCGNPVFVDEGESYTTEIFPTIGGVIPVDCDEVVLSASSAMGINIELIDGCTLHHDPDNFEWFGVDTVTLEGYFVSNPEITATCEFDITYSDLPDLDTSAFDNAQMNEDEEFCATLDVLPLDASSIYLNGYSYIYTATVGSLFQYPDNEFMTLHPTSADGDLCVTTAPDWPPVEPGEFSIVVQLVMYPTGNFFDQIIVDMEVVTIGVNPVCDAPEIVSAPELFARTSEEYTYQLEVTDVDDDMNFNYALSNAPAGMEVDVNGLITWSPAVGGYTTDPITVTVEDLCAGLTDTQVFELYVYQVDCAGVDDGEAFVDSCGECVGGTTEMMPNWAWDDCGVCFGDNMDMDCTGTCFGTAFDDDCMECSGGTSGHEANSDKDCNGDCFGEAFLDDCFVCSGGFSEHEANSDIDCFGDCFGTADVDSCGICAGGNTGLIPDADDLGCGCFEPAALEYCYDFDGDDMGTPGTETFYCLPDVPDGWILDCMDMYPAGEVTVTLGEPVIDGMGNGTVDVYYDSEVELYGYQFSLGGAIYLVNAMTENDGFQVSFNPANSGIISFSITGDTYPAGTGTLATISFMHNGPATNLCINALIVAGPGFDWVPEVYTGPCMAVAEGWMDCWGAYYGPSVLDCNAECDGTAVVDECGVCCAGMTGMDCSYYNGEDDFAGNYDCFGDCGGTAFFDTCGVCSEGNTGHGVGNDIDCWGDCFGTAYLDNCGVCSEGNSGHDADSDIDDCGVCFGYNADIDCNDECFGTAFTDDCGECVGGSTGMLENWAKDCADVCFGTSEDDGYGGCCEVEDMNYCGVCFANDDGFLPGDADGDCDVNIMDIVEISGWVLYDNMVEKPLNANVVLSNCNLMFTSHGGINVADAVAIVGWLVDCNGGLARNYVDAAYAQITQTDRDARLIADGYVGGVQMTLTHAEGFELNMTGSAMVSNYHTEGTRTTVFIIEPEDEVLFTTNDRYTIQDLVIAGSTGEIESSIVAGTPTEFVLSDVYPNPFNPVMSLDLQVAEAGYVNIQVYNLVGQSVATLNDAVLNADYYTFTWNASGQPSGIYILRVNAGSFVASQKVMLVK